MVNMKKIISIMLIAMMTVGCGRTARLERLERERAEIAAEQARVDKFGRQKGSWERFTTHVHNNVWTYLFSATAAVAVIGVGALIYHRYKKAGIPEVEGQNSQQGLEATDNVEIPQQNVLQLKWDGDDRKRWWEEDQQLWAAQQLEGHQQLTHEQQLRVDAYEAVLDAESREYSVDYSPENSVKRMVLYRQRNVAYNQWMATHRIIYKKPEKMPTPRARKGF
jgi:outer membrane protein assembly factor BamE (lipoprotein component of BamABCDE complex)